MSANQRGVSEFVKAADAGKLAAVALANGHPGLVLYTLKDGGKASATVPGCSVLDIWGFWPAIAPIFWELPRAPCAKSWSITHGGGTPKNAAANGIA